MASLPVSRRGAGSRSSPETSDGREHSFEVVARLDGPVDVDYYRHGGILPAVLRGLAAQR